MTKTYSYDVVVVGGGAAGVVAAISAARAGAKTLLVERNGFLCGHLSGFLIQHGFFDQRGEQVVHGIPFEMVERARALGGAIRHVKLNHPGTKGAVLTDGETIKFVAGTMLQEAGCDVLLNTDVIGQQSSENGMKLTIFNKSGIQEVAAVNLVDADGDADMVALAGGEFKIGRDGDNANQPMTLLFTVRGADIEKIVSVMNMPSGRSADPLPGQKGNEVNWFDATLEPWAEQAQAENLYPHVKDKKSLRFSAYSIRDGELYINASFINGLSPLDAWDLTAARFECERQVFQLVQFFRKYVPGFQNIELLSTNPTLFIRDSRRIVGDYVLTYQDFRQARRFDDVVARSGYIAAIHNPDPKGGLSLEGDANQSVSREAFDIPYRALLPRGAERIIVCGRCISADPEPLSSARSAGPSWATGQAAGAAAALSVREKVPMRRLDYQLLRQELLRQGANLG